MFCVVLYCVQSKENKPTATSPQGGKKVHMKMTSISDFREAWWTLTQEEKDYLQKAFDKLEKKEGDETDVYNALSYYIDVCGWDEKGTSAFEDFKTIVEC